MLKRERLAKAVLNDAIEWRKHALQRMLERNISRADAREVILHGEVIEDYPADKPFPSALFFKSVGGRPLHVVVAFDSNGEKAYVITAYEPTLDKFEPDFRTRRRL